MAIDAGIYSQIQQPQQPNQLASLAQAYQIKNLQQQGAEADLAADQQNKLLQLVGDPSWSQLPVDQRAAKLQGIGAFKQAGDLVTASAAAAKDQRAADVSGFDLKAKQLEAAANIAGSVTDQASYERALPMIQQMGYDTSKFSPTYNPEGVKQFAMAALSAKDRMANQTQIRSQDMQQQTALATNAATTGVSRDRLNYDMQQPKGQLVQTDAGPMIADMRAGTTRPLVDAAGNPVQKPGKEIPANVNKSIIENRQNISKIDKAISEIDAKPGALGLVNMIPGAETVRQFTDPEGVVARAGVADIGSLILHDRSGAAVTASETPRLRPFIPSASDRPEEAKKKLQRFKEIYQEEADLLSQTYGKDQGYKESKVLSGTTSGSTAARSAKPDVSSMEAELRRRGLIK